MKLLKKLVILTGKGYEKGTFTAEKNAVNISCRVNLHNLRNLSHEQYLLAIICSGHVHFAELGSQGTATKTFMLPYETDISSLHCAVAVGETIALYGTTEGKKMWESNIIDILRRRAVESKKDSIGKSEETSTKAETNSKPQKNIRDYFLDIVSDYNDEAVAEINYFGGYSSKPTSSQPQRKKLTEKYYNRLYRADALYSKPKADKNAEALQNKATTEQQNQNNPLHKEYKSDFCQTAHEQPSETKLQQSENTLYSAKEQYETTDIFADSEQNQTKTECADTAKVQSNSKVKEYYDNLKIKYNYNKSVLSELANDNIKNTESFNSTAIQSHNETESLKKIASLEKTEIFEDNISPKKTIQFDDITNPEETEGIKKPQRQENKTLIESVKIDNGEINILAARQEGNDINMRNLRDDCKQYNPRDKSFAKETPPKERQESYQPSQKNEIDLETRASGQDFITPILEAASTMNIKKAPPLQPSFSRIRIGTFYEQIKDQIEQLFKTYTRSAELEKIIPDSKWVRVDYNNDGKYYVIGIIGKPDYICYGVPAVYTPTPPVELEDYCQWLPLDIANPTEKGYWLLFQDAISGESIKNEII